MIAIKNFQMGSLFGECGPAGVQVSDSRLSVSAAAGSVSVEKQADGSFSWELTAAGGGLSKFATATLDGVAGSGPYDVFPEVFSRIASQAESSDRKAWLDSAMEEACFRRRPLDVCVLALLGADPTAEWVFCDSGRQVVPGEPGFGWACAVNAAFGRKIRPEDAWKLSGAGAISAFQAGILPAFAASKTERTFYCDFARSVQKSSNSGNRQAAVRLLAECSALDGPDASGFFPAEMFAVSLCDPRRPDVRTASFAAGLCMEAGKAAAAKVGERLASDFAGCPASYVNGDARLAGILAKRAKALAGAGIMAREKSAKQACRSLVASRFQDGFDPAGIASEMEKGFLKTRSEDWRLALMECRGKAGSGDAVTADGLRIAMAAGAVLSAEDAAAIRQHASKTACELLDALILRGQDSAASKDAGCSQRKRAVG